MIIVSFAVSVVVMAMGLLGNIGVLVVSMATRFFKSPYVINMIVFDFLSVMIGPGLSFLSFFIKPSWFASNFVLCNALGFLQNATVFCSFFGLFPLVYYGRQLHRFFPSAKFLHSFLIGSWVWSIAVASLPLLGWNSYSYQPIIKVCSYSTQKLNSGYSYSYFVAALSLSLHGVAVLCSYLSIRAQRSYRMKLQWQRHKKELYLNDPERTTFASSQSEMSVSNSIEILLATLANTKLHSKIEEEASSFHSRAINELDDTKVESQHFTSKRPTHPDEIEKREFSKGDGSKLVLSQNSAQARDDHRRNELVIDPVQDREKMLGRPCPAAYTISLNDTKFHTKKLRKFKGTISLEEFSEKEDRMRAQFIRMLLVLSCVSLIGWCPYYVVTILNLINISVPKSLWLVAYWMRFIRPVLCPVLYPICCDEYKQAIMSGARKIRKAVCPCFDDLSEKKHSSIELDRVGSNDELPSENKQAVLTKTVLFPS